LTSTIDIRSDDVADAVRWLDRARVEAATLESHVPAIRRAMDRYREATPDRSALRALQATPDRSALRALQATRLDTLLRHAADTVPAYRHIHLGKDLSPFAKLAAFPVASKEDIRGDLVNRCSDQLSRDDCFTTVTSGTTGTPTRLVLDWRHLVHAYALTALRHQYYGVPSRPRVLQPRRSIPEWATHPSPALDGAQAAFFPITANAAAVGRAVALLEQPRRRC
jgi:acyl-coenzyme A synthetase/AMP-(fatty) acid ligase